MLLAADIGGTNTRFALFDYLNGKLTTIREKHLSSKDVISLESSIKAFLSEKNDWKNIEAACFSLAGPIREDVCTFTNLDLKISRNSLINALPFISKITICNDLVAVGKGIAALGPLELHSLSNGERGFQKTKAVIAPGTGLGESYIIDGEVYPSEGSHCDFGPRTEDEVMLWRYLHQKYGHVSYERILSGSGLQDLYFFLDPKGSELEPEEISAKALAGSCPICLQAIEIFCSILGAEAGNLALKTSSLGGIYLGGGILPDILPYIGKEIFLDAFYDKGRFREFMEKIPVHLILNRKTALLGSALIAASL